jgi:hypothetical protein
LFNYGLVWCPLKCNFKKVAWRNFSAKFKLRKRLMCGKAQNFKEETNQTKI